MTIFNFDKPPKPIKCVNCGKPKDDHKAGNSACPIGGKHRVLGYTQYSGTSFFDRSGGDMDR